MSEDLVNPEPTRLRMQWGVGNPCQDTVDMDSWAKEKINTAAPVVHGDRNLQVSSEFARVGGSVGSGSSNAKGKVPITPAWAGKQDARQATASIARPVTQECWEEVSHVEVDDRAPVVVGAVDTRVTALVEARTVVLQDQIVVLSNAQAAASARDDARWAEFEGVFTARIRAEAENQARIEEGWRVNKENSDTLKVGWGKRLMLATAHLIPEKPSAFHL